MIEEDGIKLSGFDQKAFLQIRLHNKLVRIDRLSANPLDIHPQYNVPNYKVIFADLCSIILDISSKLNKTESDKINLMRINLNLRMQQPIKKRSSSSRYANRERSILLTKVWYIIQENLFQFRRQIEILMEKHGFNPSKDDESQAVIKM